jgi:23S rRNA (cytidine1920-2'-O)/16S rRNA (cytidine1409-2'-O)-methyltransferase
MAKTRLDVALVERGLAETRAAAQRLVMAGLVFSAECRLDKPGHAVADETPLEVRGQPHPYVSRGGLKLAKALDHFAVPVAGRIALDVGASTGGFTDCLLQHGAVRVIAVDTGHGQIDFRLRQDPRVRLLEKTNARYLTREQLGETVDLVVIDVSFISAALVLPAVFGSAFPESSAERQERQAVILVKPQFEVGRQQVGKGGIVRDVAAQTAAVEKIRKAVIALNSVYTDVVESPILGAEGNREFLLYAKF